MSWHRRTYRNTWMKRGNRFTLLLIQVKTYHDNLICVQYPRRKCWDVRKTTICALVLVLVHSKGGKSVYKEDKQKFKSPVQKEQLSRS